MSSEISIGEKIKTYRKLKNMKLEKENLNLISYKKLKMPLVSA